MANQNKKGTFKKDDPRINRNGRPKKGESYTDLIRAMGEREFTKKDGEVVQAKQAIVEHLFALALSGDNLPAIKFVIERIDGVNHNVAVSSVSLAEAFTITDEEQDQFEEFMRKFLEKPAVKKNKPKGDKQHG